MSFTHIKFSELKVQLSERLGDTGNTFWQDAATSEIGSYLIEALRTWSAYSNYWRDRATFNTTTNQVFYDLSVNGKDGNGNLVRGYNVKDQDILTAIQFSTMETVNPTGWSGTDMFILDDVVKAMERRRNQFLVETGMVLTQFTQNLPSPNIGRIVLPDSVIDIRRLAFKDSSSGTYTIIRPGDQWEAQSFSRNWNNSPGNPKVYTKIETPNTVVQLIPPPSNDGLLDIVSVSTGANLNPVAGVLLGIPDDFTWVIKWGALADLLSKEGQARDPLRAGYCEERWKQGIQLARIAPSILNVEIDGVQRRLDAISELDYFGANWQGTASDTPKLVAVAGNNLIALSPPPDAGPHSVTMDVVRNAVIPTLGGDYIQLGREELDAVLGYAQHLAAFKQGGEEFQATYALLSNMIKKAALHNVRLNEAGLFIDSLLGVCGKDEAIRSRRESTSIGG